MKNQSERVRIGRLLNADKEDINVATRNAAYDDFLRLANEYFQTDGKLEFLVEKGKNGIDVSLRFRAVRVKNFTVLKS